MAEIMKWDQGRGRRLAFNNDPETHGKKETIMNSTGKTTESACHYRAALAALRDEYLVGEISQADVPSEKLLQILWNEQFFAAAPVLNDGRGLLVATPGTWNVGPGPDFLNAQLRIGDDWLSGDVEVHRFPEDWFQHGHGNDPRYRRVILHVVWNGESVAARRGPNLPTLALASCLPADWRQHFPFADPLAYPYGRCVGPGACARLWAEVPDERLQRLLALAGRHRFEEKSRKFWRLIQEKGEEQALFEGLLEGLGYHANQQAFRAIAAFRGLAGLRTLPDDTARLAALFGTAGLLPDPTVATVHPALRGPVMILWKNWWAQGGGQAPITCRHGGRPLNSPERRLWGAWELCRDSGWAPGTRIMAALESGEVERLPNRLALALNIDSPWEGWQNFAVPLTRPAALLGEPRRRDLIANILLPWLQALCYGPESQETQPALAWQRLPPLQENRPLVEACHRFFIPPSRADRLLENTCLQQGLLDIYRNFCQFLNGNCQKCIFSRGVPVED